MTDAPRSTRNPKSRPTTWRSRSPRGSAPCGSPRSAANRRQATIARTGAVLKRRPAQSSEPGEKKTGWTASAFCTAGQRSLARAAGASCPVAGQGRRSLGRRLRPAGQGAGWTERVARVAQLELQQPVSAASAARPDGPCHQSGMRHVTCPRFHRCKSCEPRPRLSRPECMSLSLAALARKRRRMSSHLGSLGTPHAAVASTVVSSTTAVPLVSAPAEPRGRDIEQEIARLTWLVLDGAATPADRRRLAELVTLQHARRHDGAA